MLQGKGLPEAVINAPPHSSQAAVELHLLCPVGALAMYVKRSAAFRSTQQLFLCYSDAGRGRTLSKQGFSCWICEGVVATRLVKVTRLVPITTPFRRGKAKKTCLFST